MQVANALNNNIRILFNPKVEAFKLFDFLMVKSEQDRYLAQIIEIYDDKFDSSQNVAKLKLFYKITENNEVMPYDNFTPNRECEIIKVKQSEIENFINQDKKTFIFGTNVKSSTSLNIQYDFFNKNSVVLADKVENVNSISLNLAKNLSKEKNVIIVDSTGILEYEGAKKIKASKNFKMPLNYTTINYVFNRCLADASLEFQTIGGEILNEIKKFARKQESDFIPFNAFTRVLLEQYKATPYIELKLLLTRLKKLQMDEVFARAKKDKEALFKTVEKSKITILDLSSVDSYWQKAYLDYVISDMSQEIYLIARINEENFDVDLINKIYCEKTNVKFVPNVSYNYKKLPSIMQHCKNYILMPSLYQRSDFLDANFALSNLISDGCIIFGENTDNFLYLATDYELEIQEKRKNYRKIALTLAQEEQDTQAKLGEKGDYFENQKKAQATADSQRLMQELTDFEAQRKLQEEVNESFNQQLGIEEEASQEESFEEIENPKIEETKPESKKDDFEEFDILDSKNNTSTEIKKEAEDEFQELDNSETIQDSIEIKDETSATEETSSESNETEEKVEEEIEEKPEEEVETKEETKTTETSEISNEEKNESEEISFNEIMEESEEKEDTEKQTSEDEIIKTEEDSEKISFEEDKNEINIKEEEKEETLDIKEEHLEIDVLGADLIDPNEIEPIKTEEKQEVQNEVPQQEVQNDEDEIDLSDDELDFFQIAEDSNNENEEASNKEEEKQEVQDDDDELDLNDIADNSIDTSFEQIINTKNQQNQQTIAVDENTKINADILEKPAQKENLPIFKEEQKRDKTGFSYKIGDVIVHKKYGRGTVTKTIKYEERQLLQIEFEESGKKLLDPKVADIKLEQ